MITAPISPAAMPARTIHLHSLRFERTMRGAAIQHGLAGLMLLIAGLGDWPQPHDAHGWLTVISILSGAVLLAAVAYELRLLRQHKHGVLGWVDLFAVPMLMVEGLHKLQRGAHYLPYAYFFVAALTLARALLYTRLAHFRRITLDSGGINAQLSPMQKLRVLWQEVSTLRGDASGIEIMTTAGGRHVINLKQIWNREEVLEQVLAYYRQLSMPPGEGHDAG